VSVSGNLNDRDNRDDQERSPAGSSDGAPVAANARFGNYVLTAHLGRGGMADVFRAQRTGAAGFARTVVIKRILTEYTNDQAFVQMFINEAKIAAQLNHPNIAQVHELGEHQGQFFMALEYVHGLDLLHILREIARRDGQSKALPPAVAAYIAREVCRALQHAHAYAGPDGQPYPIIHRDVSPQNIMVSWDGQVKLVDFGIAKAMFSMREETRTGAIKGKIAYMSPEQVTGDSPGPSSDVFAIGVVLYEMLIGRRLFKGENDFETITRVKTMPVPPPSRVANWVPRELDEVVLRSLERDRTLRYRQATQMARDLDAYLASARFSTETMAEWLADAFPVAQRKEIADGQLTIPSDSSAPSRSEFPSVPRTGTLAGTPEAKASGQVSPPSISVRTLLMILGLLVAVVGSVVGTVLFLKSQATPTVVQLPAPTPVAAPAPVAIPTPVAPLPTVEKTHHKSHKKPGKIEAFDDTPAKQKPSIETFDD